jgi:bacterioferritin
MNKPALIEKLNHAISLELCAIIQYNHYASVLGGADRRVWHELFEHMSEGGLKDARTFAFRVTVLGGIPTTEPAPVRQAATITEMLNNALEHERALVAAYTAALDQASDNPAYRNLLEDQIAHEHEEVEELELYLNKVEKVAAAPKSRSQSKTA